ncbi:MAG: nitronate monooxygenase [Candidatus Goldiibacteriota bacterium HGW-Goldbacteria-1]|jgi:NAD(P)H-dependent flavin oxidoreductase YrpB (nitropropane dioxygenase family)|nr:MAG: nitronate monooxygenase [Candidatus Goldiibacteriota bacterium HGW-Goldbacteria-1]
MKHLPELFIGNLKISPPIIQGGMGIKISLAKLASAVANAGGVGTISAAIKSDHVKDRKNIEKDDALDLREFVSYVREAKALTKGIIAVNIMVALTSYPALVQAAVDEKVDIIFSGAGLPLNLPKLVEGSDVKIAPIVSSARVAEIICKTWTSKYNRIPDAIVVEGPMAGGHLGYSHEEIEEDAISPKLDGIVTGVIETVKKYEEQYGKKIPVIAAGGIYDGKDIAHMIKLGASGIQMGTRFVCTDECDADIAFKNAYINAKKEDLVIIKSPVGMPGRAIKNEFLEKAKKGEIKFKCSYLCLRTCNPAKSPYCIADALSNAAKGDLENGFAFAGSNVYRVDKIVPVKTLIDELVKEAEENLG